MILNLSTSILTSLSPIFMTKDGGLAIRMINDTGVPSVKGTLIDASRSVDNAFRLCPVDIPDAFGVVYQDGVADGLPTTIVLSGRAYVFYVGNTTRGQFARICITADTDDEDGKAIAENLPTPPFATDKHFMEIGHIIETRVGAGLALTMLHFN